MATPSQRLAEAHRASQARLAEALVRTIGRSYAASMQPGRIEFPTFASWLSQMYPLIADYRARSVSASRVYLGSVGVKALAPEPINREAVETSLTVTGWAELLERIGKGAGEPEAIEKAATAAQGAAARHALDGGRSEVARSFQAQTKVGWYRITRADCCAFCAALASRGAVYGEDSFADSDPRFIGDGTIKVHDHDHCTLGSVEKNELVPEQNQHFGDLWQSSTEGFSGKAAMNAFRRALEAERRG